ncbi:Transmembrane channel 5 [Paramuricea clavata]|nr:Transmembrane channel 5 [Paramuricea clavata]
MEDRHVEDFKSLESIDSGLSDATRRHGPRNQHRIAPSGQLNPAFGTSDEHMEMSAMNGNHRPGSHEDVMMTDMLTDMTFANGSQQMRDDDNMSQGSKDGDDESIASTDTYQSGTSMSSELQQDLKESLPSHLFREIRNLPSAKRRKIIQERATPEGGSLRHRPQHSIRRGLDETDFVLMGEEGEAQAHEEIRHMATSLDRKKIALNQVQDHMKDKEQNISTFRYFKLRLAANWQRFRKKVVSTIKDNELWSGPLKKIQGKFGTRVLSYFIFLRWLFLLNILIFLLVLIFIFIPQIIYRPSTKYGNLTSFHGTDLLDGGGWFNGTELYYGHYTSDTIQISAGYGYEMPLAYLLTCATYFLLCLILMVTSMTSLYEKNYLEGGVGANVLTTKIFTAWDYSVTDREACFIKQQSIATDIEECLAETKDKRVLSRKEWFKLICLRIFTNFISIALIACATYLIVEVVAGYPVEEDTTIFQELLLPLLVSFLNLLLPGMFRIIASFEDYAHGATAVKVSLARTVVLKLCTLAGIFVSLYSDINCASDDGSSNCRIIGCWENYVGQTFYRLVWVDFAFILLATFFGEFIRRLLASRVEWWGNNVGCPGFDISRNVLDLIYAQCLCWFGTFFSPLLSFICLFKLWVLFYVKKTSVLNNCRPSVRPFLASKMNLLFLVLLGISYALILVAFGYAVTSSGSRLSPSDCGPFTGKDTIYQVVLDSVNTFPDVLKEIIRIISSPAIIALIFVVFG